MNRTRIQERLGNRYFRPIVVVIMCLIVGISGLAVWKFTTAMPGERTSIILLSDPVYVLSWDNKRGQLTMFALPPDLRIDGAYGVGSYPISSLRKLETIDGTKIGLFARSMEDALGLPIVGVMEGRASLQKNPVELAKEALGNAGDIALPLRLRLWFLLTMMRPDGVTTVDLSARGVYKSEAMPDGSVARIFDANRYDAVIGGLLEVDTVRKEGLRVRVTNTTGEAGLGSRAARIVSHAGMVVVVVDSEAQTLKKCTLAVPKPLWGTYSVAFIQAFFDCSLMEAIGDGQADLTIRLGEEYAKLFQSDQ